MAKRSTAKRIKDLTRYQGDVALFELSKQYKKGAVSTKYIIVGRFKPRSGSINTTAWFANGEGKISLSEPIMQSNSKDMADALDQLGYNLI